MNMKLLGQQLWRMPEILIEDCWVLNHDVIGLVDPASQADEAVVNPGEGLNRLSAPFSASSEEREGLAEFSLFEGGNSDELSQYQGSLPTSAMNPDFLQEPPPFFSHLCCPLHTTEFCHSQKNAPYHVISDEIFSASLITNSFNSS